MRKIEKLKSDKERLNQNIRAVREEISGLEAKIQTIGKNADNAAESGDISRYKELNAEREDIILEIDARKKQLEAYERTDFKLDAVDAWKEYVGLYNRNLNKKLCEFNSAWLGLARLYMEIVGLQNEALKTRKEVLEAGGYALDTAWKLTSQEEDKKYPDFPMDSMRFNASLENGVRWNGQAWDAIPAAFLETGALPADAAKYISNVVERHIYHEYRA